MPLLVMLPLLLLPLLARLNTGEDPTVEVLVRVERHADTMLLAGGELPPSGVGGKRGSPVLGLPIPETMVLPGVGGVVRGKAMGVEADGVSGGAGLGVDGAGVSGAGVDGAGVVGAVELLPVSGASIASPDIMPDTLGITGPLGFSTAPVAS